MEESASFDEDLQYEVDVRKAYQEILENISTIRETLQHFRRSSSRRCSFESFDGLQKDRCLSLPVSSSKRPICRERSHSCNESLVQRDGSSLKMSKQGESKVAAHSKVLHDLNNNEKCHQNRSESGIACSDSRKTTCTHAAVSKTFSPKFIRRALATLNQSERNGKKDKNSGIENEGNHDRAIIFKTLKTKSDTLHIVKGNV